MPKPTRKTDVPTGHAALLAAVSSHQSAAEQRRARVREVRGALADLGTVVYFIKFGSNIKIGYTTDLYGRLRKLRRPTTAILAVMPGGLAQEQELHQRFAAARIQRYELFEPVPELIVLINELRTKSGVAPVRVVSHPLAQDGCDPSANS